MKIPLAILLAILPLHVYGQQPAASAERGEKLYSDFGCHACHGYNATMRVPLVGDDSAIMASEQLFLTYLRLRGEQNPVNPKNTMPNYDAATLRDDQALDIYAYIKSVSDDPPAIADDPVMRAILDAAKAREQHADRGNEEQDAGVSQ